MSNEPKRQPAKLVCHFVAIGLLAVLLATAPGCASDKSKSASNLPVAREDVKELRQITADSIKAVNATLQSLDQVRAQAPCPPRLFNSFTKDVQRLEVDSFKMRARAQAIRVRGQAYFDQ